MGTSDHIVFLLSPLLMLAVAEKGGTEEVGNITREKGPTCWNRGANLTASLGQYGKGSTSGSRSNDDGSLPFRDTIQLPP